jgi:hypothetical protein
MSADVIEMETAPETASYRHYRRMIWQTIRLRYADQLADAKLRGTAGEPARRAAAQSVRGDVRALMSELLTRAPVPAILEFLAVGREWGEAGERLLEQHDAVTGLIDSAYPRPTWTALEFLDREAAEEDARWSAWTESWTDAFRATGAVAHEALAGKPTGPTNSEEKDQSSARRWWAPWLTSAAALVVATTVVVVATRE